MMETSILKMNVPIVVQLLGVEMENQNSLTCHFGLGSQTEIEAIEVRFIGGEVVRYEGPIDVDQRLKVTESGQVTTLPQP